jgi:hypothetical protein
MNYKTHSQAQTRTAMIEEALTLLRIIEAEHSNEDINEAPKARETRLLLRTAARQLVAKIIEDIEASDGLETPEIVFAQAA